MISICGEKMNESNFKILPTLRYSNSFWITGNLYAKDRFCWELNA